MSLLTVLNTMGLFQNTNLEEVRLAMMLYAATCTEHYGYQVFLYKCLHVT